MHVESTIRYRLGFLFDLLEYFIANVAIISSSLSDSSPIKNDMRIHYQQPVWKNKENILPFVDWLILNNGPLNGFPAVLVEACTEISLHKI